MLPDLTATFAATRWYDECSADQFVSKPDNRSVLDPMLIELDRHHCRFCLEPLACVLVLLGSTASGERLGSFVWNDETGQTDPDKPIRVYFSRPDELRPDTPVWFSIHGMGRNGEGARNHLAEAAASEGALILAPEFTDEDWPGSSAYNLGNISTSESDRSPKPRSEWSFSKIEALFDFVRETAAPVIEADSYSMFGHSAGGQFVHRFLMWEPNARVKVAVAANAGWYTVPVDEAEEAAWPYSVRRSPDYDAGTPATDPLPEANLNAAFGKRLMVLLGEEDTLRTSNLRQTANADAQGPHRLARGGYFFGKSQAEAERRDATFRWGLQTVPEVGHSGRGMAIPAAEIMRLADAEPGDLNGDGQIDEADYQSWRQAYGSTPSLALGPDANGDTVVDAADYSVWRDALSQQSSEPTPPSQPLPEPGSAAIVGFLLVGSATQRRPLAVLQAPSLGAATVSHAD